MEKKYCIVLGSMYHHFAADWISIMDRQKVRLRSINRTLAYINNPDYRTNVLDKIVSKKYPTTPNLVSR